MRWRRGRGLEERIRRELPGAEGYWQALDPLDTPFDLLDDGEGKHIGLLVDLGSYWRQVDGQRGSVVDLATFRRRGIEEP